MERFHMTNKGLEYVSKTATGSILKITKGKFGDGTATGTITELTDLVNPLGDMPISKQTTSGNAVTIQTQFSNKINGVILSPFYLKELGLYAKLLKSDGTDDTSYPETLIAYAYATGADQGDRIPGVLTEFLINFPCTVANSDNVQVVISSMAYALQADLDKKADKQNASGGFNGGASSNAAKGGGAIGQSSYAYRGGSAGYGATTGDGFAGGYNAKCNDGTNSIDAVQLGTGTNSVAKTLKAYDFTLMKADGKIPNGRITNTLGGFQSGSGATTTTGGSVGINAYSSGGGAVGTQATTEDGGAVGMDANSELGGAVGQSASALGGFAGGYDTKTGSGVAVGDSAKTVDDNGNAINAIQLGTGTNKTAKTLQVYDYQLMTASGYIPADRMKRVIGTLSDLETSKKTTIVQAINSLKDETNAHCKVKGTATAAEITSIGLGPIGVPLGDIYRLSDSGTIRFNVMVYKDVDGMNLIDFVEKTLTVQEGDWIVAASKEDGFVILSETTDLSSYYTKTEIDGKIYSITGDISTLDDSIGDVSTLETTAKSNLVAAINEVNSTPKTLPIVVATSTDGRAYTATLNNVSELTTGLSFIIVPDKVSATTTPTLDLNGLGAKSIKMSVSSTTALTQNGTTNTWLSVNKPIQITYDGTQWKTELQLAHASYLYGTVPISKGGTGATTAAQALENLGCVKIETGSYVGTEGVSSTLHTKEISFSFKPKYVWLSGGGSGGTSASMHCQFSGSDRSCLVVYWISTASSLRYDNISVSWNGNTCALRSTTNYENMRGLTYDYIAIG